MLLCDVGRDSSNFKYAPQMEKVGTYEVEKNEKIKGQTQSSNISFPPSSQLHQ